MKEGMGGNTTMKLIMVCFGTFLHNGATTVQLRVRVLKEEMLRTRVTFGAFVNLYAENKNKHNLSSKQA